MRARPRIVLQVRQHADLDWGILNAYTKENAEITTCSETTIEETLNDIVERAFCDRDIWMGSHQFGYSAEFRVVFYWSADRIQHAKRPPPKRIAVKGRSEPRKVQGPAPRLA